MLAGLKVMPVQKRDPFLNILIYGDSGIGKTTLAGSADAVPSMRPVLFVDIEGGTESLRHTYPEVEVVRATNWKEIQDLYHELDSGKYDYRTVVIDSLTEAQKFNMYDIMVLQGARKAERGEEMDPDIPSMREWGKNTEQIRRFVRQFRDLPMNTLFTALVKTDKNARTGKITAKPSLSGKLADEVAAFLDVVLYYYVKQMGDDENSEQVRFLLTQKTEENIAKDRSGRLPLVVEQPTMQALYDIMYATNIQKDGKKVNG